MNVNLKSNSSCLISLLFILDVSGLGVVVLGSTNLGLCEQRFSGDFLSASYVFNTFFLHFQQSVIFSPCHRAFIFEGTSNMKGFLAQYSSFHSYHKSYFLMNCWDCINSSELSSSHEYVVNLYGLSFLVQQKHIYDFYTMMVHWLEPCGLEFALDGFFLGNCCDSFNCVLSLCLHVSYHLVLYLFLTVHMQRVPRRRMTPL